MIFTLDKVKVAMKSGKARSGWHISRGCDNTYLCFHSLTQTSVMMYGDKSGYVGKLHISLKSKNMYLGYSSFWEGGVVII